MSDDLRNFLAVIIELAILVVTYMLLVDVTQPKANEDEND